MYLFYRQNNREREGGRGERYRETQLLLHSPNGCNGHGWARLEPGAQNLVQVFHMDRRAQGLKPSAWNPHPILK